MILRLGIFLSLMHLAILAQAQKDTVLLDPVTVYGIPDEKYLAGSTVLKLDSTLASNYNSSHLGELLSFQFPIYFRNYGSGMISGISMRGTSPQHTAVLWNGININSFSLGQSDFSILPAVAFDEVKVHSGGGSSRFGSGAFGGAVLLRTNSENKPLLSVRQEIGSFNRFFTSVKSSFRVRDVVFASSLYNLQSENNFVVQKTGRKQNNAAFLQRGFVQSVEYHFSQTKTFQLNYWLHDADREVQPTTGNSDGTDQQQDRNHRLSFSYQQNGEAGFFKAGGGYVDDKIVFNGGPSTVQRWIAFASHQFHFRNQMSVHVGADWNHIVGKIKEYGENHPVEERVDVFISTQKRFNRINLSANLRKPFISKMTTPLLPYLGAEITLVKKSNSELVALVNASRNFRAPTFNDRYWENLGRKDLLPEESNSTEAGLSWSYYSLKLTTTTFYQMVDQWILWSPDDDGIYHPQNIKKVKTRGLEGSLVQRWVAGKFKQQISFSYQYTQATTVEADEPRSIGKQLIYTPFHAASGSVVSRFEGWSLNIFLQYSGKRFTTDTNTPGFELDPYSLIDVAAGKSFIKGRHTFNALFAVKNVFDADYQQYSSRAMPGRNYSFTLSYQLNNKSTKL